MVKGLSWRNLLNNGINLVVNKMNSFVVGKKLALCKKFNLEPPQPNMHIEIDIFLIILWCDIASIFHVLTYTAATSHVAEFSDED